MTFEFNSNCGAYSGAGRNKRAWFQSTPTPNLASAGYEGELNAAYTVALVFDARFPRKSLPPKQIATSAKSTVPPQLRLAQQHVRASIKFWRASDRANDRGNCEPVNTIGFPNPTSINDSALAAYAIVSVPCATTNAEYSSLLSCSARASVTQSFPSISLESLFINTSTSSRAKSRSSGITSCTSNRYFDAPSGLYLPPARGTTSASRSSNDSTPIPSVPPQWSSITRGRSSSPVVALAEASRARASDFTGDARESGTDATNAS